MIAQLAMIEGTGVLRGEAGVAARRREVRRVRITVVSLLVVAGLAPFIASKSPPVDWPTLLLLEAGIAMYIAFTVGIAMAATPFIHQNRVYGDRIPPRAIWDRTALGAFGAEEVEAVEVAREMNNDLEWIEVVVRAKSGAKATFRGFTRDAIARQVAAAAASLDPKGVANVAKFAGGAEEVIDWARREGLAIREAAPPPR